ncbi:MAG: four helix bundle protein [Bacteroidota bacterium]
MANIEKFEDIQAWQKARELAHVIYKLCEKTSLKKDYRLKDQILGSSGSVMDNIAEGFDRGGNKEFVHFLTISKASAGEVKSQLYRALDRKHIDRSTFETIYAQADEICKMLAGLIVYLNKSDLKGIKYKDRRN